MNRTIAVAVSGGVDSLTAAHLLIRQGHRVLGVHFLNGFETAHGRSAAQGDDIKLAHQRLAPLENQLNIPITVVDLAAEFRNHVVHYFVGTYLSGQTPNPCLVCNPHIKFDLLAQHARKLGADALATGHYARKSTDGKGRIQLRKGLDPHKDQSYFLARLTQEQLAFACFPLAELQKHETIALARENGLVPITRQESQDICFISNGNYGEFLLRQPGVISRPGPIEDVNGNVIGTHQGLHLFTIGQRRGINCPAAFPYYVVRLDPRRNTLVVGFKEALGCAGCRVIGINWIEDPPSAPFQSGVRVRYRHKEVPATITPGNESDAIIRFDLPQNAVTPGQGAVFYKKDRVLGGGWITQTYEEMPS